MEHLATSARRKREENNGHRGAVFWLTGLSGAGKSTLARGIDARLFQTGMRVAVLDGDIMRKGLCAGLGFSLEERQENLRRVAHTAALLVELGHICLCACIAPLRAHRQMCRQIIGQDYHEIFVDCPLAECQRRDVKGLYAKVNAGLVAQYTGVSSPYEVPLTPDLTLHTSEQDVDSCLRSLETYILSHIRLG